MDDFELFDVTLETESTQERTKHLPTGLVTIPLPLAVARGVLYIRNGNGEFEQVIHASYWRLDGIYGVTTKGYEYNEDGDITRQF